MIRALRPEEYPELLKEIPQPPKQLRLEGKLPIEGNKLLAIVGSRKYSAYARETCEAIIAGLAGSPVTIVSGLALGIDSIAHRAAMRAELQTIALPESHHGWHVPCDHSGGGREEIRHPYHFPSGDGIQSRSRGGAGTYPFKHFGGPSHAYPPRRRAHPGPDRK